MTDMGRVRGESPTAVHAVDAPPDQELGHVHMYVGCMGRRPIYVCLAVHTLFFYLCPRNVDAIYHIGTAFLGTFSHAAKYV